MKGRRIPRPFERWLISIAAPLDWVDTDDADAPEWVRRIRFLSAGIGCRVIYDPGRHWKESFFCSAAADGKPYILSGGDGKENYCCTALLHEFGHAILHVRHNHPSAELPGEEEAWQLANQIAQKERLLLVPSIRRKGLYSYRRAELLESVAGSKNRTQRQSLPKTGKLTRSLRSTVASLPPDTFPLGKKGRRKTKRDIKRSTAKAERRVQRDDLE
ncbi:MAG: hypothetical protein ACOC6B_06885 [Thermodesulfobacteriota bacterium]